MKKIIISFLITILMISSIFAVTSNGQGNGQGAGHENPLRDGSGMGQGKNMKHSQGGYTYEIYDDTRINHTLEIESYPKEDLSEYEISSLLKMREEEKLARDVYLELYDIYGMQIFSNIARSEQKHTDAIKSILDKYGLEDSVKSDVRGEFTNLELKNLYETLVAKGSINLSEALIVGATVEDLDIYDLQKDLEKVDNLDIISTYNNLEKGSRNHMRSFTKTLEKTSNQIYVPVYISKEYYAEIISNEMESGNNYNSNQNSNSQNAQIKENNNNNNKNTNQNQINEIEDKNNVNLENKGFFTKFWGGIRNWF